MFDRLFKSKYWQIHRRGSATTFPVEVMALVPCTFKLYDVVWFTAHSYFLLNMEKTELIIAWRTMAKPFLHPCVDIGYRACPEVLCVFPREKGSSRFLSQDLSLSKERPKDLGSRRDGDLVILTWRPSHKLYPFRV